MSSTYSNHKTRSRSCMLYISHASRRARSIAVGLGLLFRTPTLFDLVRVLHKTNARRSISGVMNNTRKSIALENTPFNTRETLQKNKRAQRTSKRGYAACIRRGRKRHRLRARNDRRSSKMSSVVRAMPSVPLPKYLSNTSTAVTCWAHRGREREGTREGIDVVADQPLAPLFCGVIRVATEPRRIIRSGVSNARED